MAIEITPEVERLVHGIYSDGRYASETEVIAAALHLLQRREQLRKDIEQGVRELDTGQRIEADEVFAALRHRAAELDGRSA
jgi:antitoxin ParD1/3/4